MARLRGLPTTGERASHPKGGSLDKFAVALRGLLRITGSVARLIRPGTIGLCLIFATTAYWGVEIVRFERLNDQVGRAEDASPEAADGLLESVAAWKDMPGVASRARGTALGIVLNHPTSVAAVAHALFDVAEASPTSSAAWESLAEIEAVRGDDMDHVLDAFRMSALTGSHEGAVMKQRALFGLKHWTELPQQDRDVVVRDIAATAGVPQLSPQDYRKIFEVKSDAEREQIRAALTAVGFDSKPFLKTLGL
jgi:hypothetical protein